MEKIFLEFFVSYYLIICEALFLIGSWYNYIPNSAYLIATCNLQADFGYFITGFISIVDILISKPKKFKHDKMKDFDNENFNLFANRTSNININKSADTFDPSHGNLNIDLITRKSRFELYNEDYKKWQKTFVLTLLFFIGGVIYVIAGLLALPQVETPTASAWIYIMGSCCYWSGNLLKMNLFLSQEDLVWDFDNKILYTTFLLNFIGSCNFICGNILARTGLPGFNETWLLGSAFFTISATMGTIDMHRLYYRKKKELGGGKLLKEEYERLPFREREISSGMNLNK